MKEIKFRGVTTHGGEELVPELAVVCYGSANTVRAYSVGKSVHFTLKK